MWDLQCFLAIMTTMLVQLFYYSTYPLIPTWRVLDLLNSSFSFYFFLSFLYVPPGSTHSVEFDDWRPGLAQLLKKKKKKKKMKEMDHFHRIWNDDNLNFLFF